MSAVEKFSRLSILSKVGIVAVVVIVAMVILGGSFPIWMFLVAFAIGVVVVLIEQAARARQDAAQAKVSQFMGQTGLGSAALDSGSRLVTPATAPGEFRIDVPTKPSPPAASPSPPPPAPPGEFRIDLPPKSGA